MDLQRVLAVAQRAATAGAAELMQRRGNAVVREKAPRDLVTDADLASQAAIRAIVEAELPEFLFVGEEDGASPETLQSLAQDDRPCWIVDPLDGTANFVHRLQNFAVSIALVHRGQALVGVVDDPVYEERFWAVRGGGAFTTRRRDPGAIRLRSSTCTQLDHALVACSFSPRVQRQSSEVRQFIEVLEQAQAVRRLGSAALNLCYVAAARLDAYWATAVKAWDVAAGVLIAEEAGATVTALDAQPLDIWNPRMLVSATEPLHQNLCRLLAV
jgi:myo-inositol-1(or 4)-monophosphatase